MKNIFEKASRVKLRFPTVRGELTVEDLWTLPLVHTSRINLDVIAIDAHKALQEKQKNESVSFVKKSAVNCEIEQLRFDVVIHIIKTKTEEEEAAKTAAASREHRAKIIGIIEAKKEAELHEMSVADLQKLL